MQAMPNGFVDLAYIDPPFFTQREYRNIRGDKESVQDYRDAQFHFSDKANFFEMHVHNGTQSLDAYLTWMRCRLTEIHRLLKDGGTLVCHLDYHAVHYIKVVLDEIFGIKNFRNEIIWVRGNVWGGKAVGHQFARNHDTLLYYTKPGMKNTFNRQFRPYSEEYKRSAFNKDDNDGRGPYDTSRVGTRSEEGLKKLRKEGRVYTTSNGTERIKCYLREMKGIALDDVWTDILEVSSRSAEKTGWPTQKPVALLERILRGCSNEGDVVFDCFAGCGTAMHAAHNLKRKWVGIDISPTAIKVATKRLVDLGAKVDIIDEDGPSNWRA